VARLLQRSYREPHAVVQTVTPGNTAREFVNTAAFNAGPAKKNAEFLACPASGRGRTSTFGSRGARHCRWCGV